MDKIIVLLESMTKDIIEALSQADYYKAKTDLETLYRATMRAIHETQVHTHQQSRRFDLALSHAMQIIQLAPHSDTGYLYAGHCLEEQSKLHQAITLYDQGLQYCSTSSDDGIFDNDSGNSIHDKGGGREATTNNNLLSLIDRRAKASAQLNRRIPNWIHQLPYCVVSDDILPYLTMQERRTCLNVSRSWRTLLSRCTPLWRTLEFQGDASNGNNTNNNDDLIECIGPHVTRVAFSRMSAQQLQLIFQKLVQHESTKLESLTLIECDINTDQFACLDRICQNSLRYLEINNSHLQQQRLSLQQLLDNCPTLTHLYLKQSSCGGDGSKHDEEDNQLHQHRPYIHDHRSNSNGESTLYKSINVTHLYLDCDTPINHLLRRFSKLEYLALESQQRLELYTCTTLCPNLRHFQINVNMSRPDWSRDFNNDDAISPRRRAQQHAHRQQQKLDGGDSSVNNKEGQGLRHLILGKSMVSDQERICAKRVIEQNRDTLETLTLHAQQGERRNWAWIFGSALDPHRLCSLDLSVELDGSLIPLLRRSAETLQHVSLRNMVCVDDNVLDTLGELPSLRTLALLDCVNITEPGMIRYFTIAPPSSSALLEHLEIAGYSFCLTKQVLEFMGRRISQHIKSFTLSWCGFGSADRMHALVKTMVTCKSRVQQLSFTRSSIHADTLDALGDLSELQELKLCMCTNVTDMGVRQLVDKKQFTKSFSLDISECNMLSPQLARYAHDIMGDRFCYVKG